LIIIPSYEAEAGIGHLTRQIDFTLLPTARGLVVNLIADDVTVEREQYHVSVSGPTNRITRSDSQALRDQLEELNRKKKLNERLSD
jgi:hypothetical protein